MPKRDDGIISWQSFHHNDGTRFAELLEHSTYWHVLGSTVPQVPTRADALKIIDELRSRRRFDGR
jgi:hypothetical protein